VSTHQQRYRVVLQHCANSDDRALNRHVTAWSNPRANELPLVNMFAGAMEFADQWRMSVDEHGLAACPGVGPAWSAIVRSLNVLVTAGAIIGRLDTSVLQGLCTSLLLNEGFVCGVEEDE